MRDSAEDKKHLAGRKLSLLKDLIDLDSGNEEALDVAREIIKEFPDLQKILTAEKVETPSQRRSKRGYFIEPAEGFDFKEIIEANPNEYLESLLQAPENSFRGDRWDYPQNLEKIFGMDRQWAEGYIRCLVSRVIADRSIWQNSLRSWVTVFSENSDWVWLFNQLESLPLEAEPYAGIAYIISHHFWGKDSKLDEITLSKGTTFMKTAWKLWADQDEKGYEDSRDSLTSAINTVGGWIGEYWIHHLSHLRERSGDSSFQIPTDIREIFVKAFKGESGTAEYARISMIPWTPYLFVWDQDFGVSHIIPQFDFSSDSKKALTSWAVYMNYRRAAFFEMEKALVPHYLEASKRMDENPDWLKQLEKKNALNRFGFMIAQIIFEIVDDPIEAGVVQKTVPFLPLAARNGLMKGIGDRFKSKSSEEQKLIWENWLELYLENRLNGIPAPFDREETVSFPEWCLDTREFFPKLVAIFVSAKMPLGKVFTHPLIRQMLDSPLVEKFPDESCQYLYKIIQHSEYLGHDDDIIRLFSKIESLIPKKESTKNLKDLLFQKSVIRKV